MAGKEPPAKQVLVLDSDPAVLEFLQLALQGHDITAQVASTPDEAVELVRRHSLMVGVVDADMLAEHGTDLLPALRKLCPSIRFCLVDAGIDTIPSQDHGRLGIACSFRKPFTLIQLVHALEPLLNSQAKQ